MDKYQTRKNQKMMINGIVVAIRDGAATHINRSQSSSTFIKLCQHTEFIVGNIKVRIKYEESTLDETYETIIYYNHHNKPMVLKKFRDARRILRALNKTPEIIADNLKRKAEDLALYQFEADAIKKALSSIYEDNVLQTPNPVFQLIEATVVKDDELDDELVD